MAEKWTDADMSKFLEIYQNYEVLWNPKIELYRNNQARKSALEAILQHMNKPGLTEYELKNKIKNIRTMYNRELTRVKKALTSGTGTDLIYTPTLVWFKQADMFLRAVTEARSSKSNLNIASQSQSQHVSGDDEDALSNTSHPHLEEVGDQAETPPPSRNANISESSVNPRIIECSKAKSKKRKAHELFESSALGEALGKLEDISKSVKLDDEFETFGKHIANQLRQLPLHRALQIQQNFQSILTGERIQSLNMMAPRSLNMMESATGSYSSSTTWSPVTSPLLSPTGSSYESANNVTSPHNTFDILNAAFNTLDDE